MNLSALVFMLLLCCAKSHGQVAEKDYQPRYPTSPICRDDAGATTLSFYIQESGKPHKIEIENTDSVRFIRSAIKTLSKYRYKQGTFDIHTHYQKVFHYKPDVQCNKNS